MIDNTLTSIAAAFAFGADAVEIDVRRTKDDQFVLFHDYALDCRTDAIGPVAEHTALELKAIDVGYGYTADSGQTFPLRGKGIGLMPTLADVALLNVGLVRWDERSGADEAESGVEGGPLLGCGNEHRAGPATLGPRAFEFYAIAAVRIAWLELDAFFTPQAELLLQFLAHAHVWIGHPLDVVTEVSGLVLIGYLRSVGDAKVSVVCGNNPRPTYLFRPPAQNRQSVLDRAGRQSFD